LCKNGEFFIFTMNRQFAMLRALHESFHVRA
jgi:hypothetical protein